MAEARLFVVFTVEGHPVRLCGSGQWRAAITRGDLTPELSVIVEEDGEEIYAGPAGDHELLSGLFPAPAPEPASMASAPDEGVEPPSPDAEPALPDTAPLIGSTGDVKEGGKPDAEPLAPVLPQSASTAEPPLFPPSRPSSGNGNGGGLGCLTILVCIILVFVLAYCMSGDRTASSEPRYFETVTDLTDGPGGAFAGRASRGEQVTVRIPRNGTPEWLEIEGGVHDGRYAPASALSPSPRPRLRETGSAKTIRGLGVNVRAEPGGAVIGEVNTGDHVHELGVTADGWSEVRFEKGVGYVATRYVRRRR